MTVQGALRQTTRALRASDGGSFEAALLLSNVLGRDRAWLLAHGEETLTVGNLKALEALTARRSRGEPLAYVLEEAWFFGRRFVVTPHVLVPRPETECIVETALADLRSRSHAGAALRACDVGTGSGAIALTLAAELRSLEVVATDLSPEALGVARRNAALLHVAQRVRFVQGDLAEPLFAFAPYDCLVANLPYVPTRDVPLPPDPVSFEPRLAVDGGADGLDLYRRLISHLPRLLAARATAYFEAAPPALDALADLIERNLRGAHLEIGEDYAGLERWVAISLTSASRGRSAHSDEGVQPV
ncbi:MAG: peptide chain release factor N(5)-glutamine methyltransferase [Candidatus Eremiobacteraeota bacterium]|nr:peptide chain release factor N(5)-glutamine methyltransferase [Candidatus Eremiobacteraeota bacterium]MBV9646685.1 peptide chain release factor N(5)-glutamine methyltransferase [Candidatus Eremiobacteraeota bacterium]